MQAATRSTTTPRSDALVTILVWIARIIVVGLPIQAFLASYGLFEGERSFVSAHQAFGMILVLLVAVQVAIYAVLAQRGRAPRGAVISSTVGLFIYLVQLGLGFATREDAGMAAWHIPLGVMLMGGGVMNLLRVNALRDGRGME